MIWNEKAECMPAGRMQELQSERLKSVVKHVYSNCRPYREKMDACGVRPEDIKGIGDIVRLPFTVKDDMRRNYPFGLFSVPPERISEMHVSSGTSGDPIVVGYTASDVDLWGEVMARAFCCAGAVPGDMVQVSYGYGLFTGGFGMHYGAKKAGLTIIPASSGQTKRQLKLMHDFRPRILACTPSYALYMLEEARELGMDPRGSSWQIGIFGAEPWSESMRAEIETSWNMLATDIYGLSEITGPGVAQECLHKQGLHICWDVFYPEIVDPAGGMPVPEGMPGELVITTLTKEGMPMLRYRTRDIVSLERGTCPCGRTSPRLSKIKGRTDDMIVVRGINVFPSQIEHVLLRIEGIEPHYQILVDRKAGKLDELEIDVEVEEGIFFDEVKKLRELEERICREIESVLGIFVKVRLVEPRSIERSEGKARRVIDRRTV